MKTNVIHFGISFVIGFVTAFAWVRYVVKQTFGPLVEETESRLSDYKQ